MNLHLDKEAFRELVTAASEELHIPAGVIEKDYFVTLVLKKLSSKIPDMVFKGGTSLTKCYQLLDRFSEDIDISYAASSGIPGESRKRQLKKAIVDSMEELHLPITNLDGTRSRRNYNCYRATYPSLYEPLLELNPELVIETYIALLPFPTVERMADNYIYRFLKLTAQEELAERFQLMPFPVTTQTIERTLVDKVFAICDYYLEGKVPRHSRHLYDICKIMEIIPEDVSLTPLIQAVRNLRMELPICPSAKPGVSVNQVLEELVENDVYKDDYERITKSLLFVQLPYQETIKSLRLIIKKKYF